MNAMQMLFSAAWVERLGMTLLHFLWQGLVIAILYAVARRIVARTSNPQTRYLLGCGALAAMMAAPLLTWQVLRPPDPNPEAMYRIRSAPRASSTAGIATTAALPMRSARRQETGAAPSTPPRGRLPPRPLPEHAALAPHNRRGRIQQDAQVA